MFFKVPAVKSEELKGKSDEELLHLSLSNPSVFSLLVERYQGAFLKKGKQILKSPEEAEDAVQEAFVKIYINIGAFQKKEGASFKSWGYRIFLNQCFTVYKKLKIEKDFLLLFGQETAELIPDKNISLEHEKKLSADYLLSVVSKLPDILRQVLSLHFIQDKPIKEVAGLLGISEGAVRTRIFRAKKELREKKLEYNLS